MREHFKRDPKKGFRYLEHVGIFSTSGLDKVVVGNCLGEKADFDLAVLRAYRKCFDFDRLSLDEAFRLFLSTRMLPGEA